MKKKKEKDSFLEKALVTWLKHDPLVKAVVKNDDITRKYILLNLLGKVTAKKYFKDIPMKKWEEGIIYPVVIRKVVEESLHNSKNRTQLINKLIFWATDKEINNRYINSHLSRVQIVSSLLGPIFFHANEKQTDLIVKGLKFMLVHKKTSIGLPGEQSRHVHKALLNKISDILVHNQQVIINKAVGEAEEKMRLNLIRQIHELRGERRNVPYYGSEFRKNIHKITKEKFPLSQNTVKHLEEMLEFYSYHKLPEISLQASKEQKRIEEIRLPLS